MLYGKYRFHSRFEDEAVLPFYKGSTFRGVFGRALKKVVCALKRQECHQCLLKERCIYTLVFETQLAYNSPEKTRFGAVPHPFVIEPPLVTQTHFQQGDTFDFCLLLFGEVNHNLPYFIYAFDQMGRIGIGKRINGKRGHFNLKSVKCGEKLIYSEIDQKLTPTDAIMELVLDEPKGQKEKKETICVTLETPLRLKFANRLQADLPFHVLARAMLRRVSSLLNCYGEGEPALDYKGLVKKAESVKTKKSELNWFDWRRYSFRQDKDMLMGGMVGSVTYEGAIGEFMPLLEFCSEVHIGKQTTFGLGKFRAEKV